MQLVTPQNFCCHSCLFQLRLRRKPSLSLMPRVATISFVVIVIVTNSVTATDSPNTMVFFLYISCHFYLVCFDVPNGYFHAVFPVLQYLSHSQKGPRVISVDTTETVLQSLCFFPFPSCSVREITLKWTRSIGYWKWKVVKEHKMCFRVVLYDK